MKLLTKHPTRPDSRQLLTRMTKLHLVLGLVIIVQIILYDAGKLITPDAVFNRWLVTGGFILTVGIVLYLARLNHTEAVIRNLTWVLITADIALASFFVYAGRGFASKAVLLFVLPIIVALVMQRKGALLLAGLASTIAYTTTAVGYFVFNFNEGYKLELYGEIGFYSAVLLIISLLLWSTIKKQPTKAS